MGSTKDVAALALQQPAVLAFLEHRLNGRALLVASVLARRALAELAARGAMVPQLHRRRLPTPAQAPRNFAAWVAGQCAPHLPVVEIPHVAAVVYAVYVAAETVAVTRR